MKKLLYDSSGKTVKLGEIAGTGGEADVFEIPASKNQLVAKVYRQPLPPIKQSKISAMVRKSADDINKIAAWPLDTTCSGINGPIVGFIMSKAIGAVPIHKFYNPEDRKFNFPNHNWYHLIWTARNVAAAFSMLHERGCIVGDVNDGNILVRPDGHIWLIDCDSMQLELDGIRHLCEVGSLAYTPPELQNVDSFRNKARKINHDNFGLAVIIFRLLFMGWHPYAGRHCSSQDSLSIDEAIAGCRYAYGRSAHKKNMLPPLHHLDISIAANKIAEMFESAFCEVGTKRDSRPKANEWVNALEDIAARLITCKRDPVHKYLPESESCPWCRYYQETGFNCFGTELDKSLYGDGFDLEAAWDRIISVPDPKSIPKIDVRCFSVEPKPLPEEVQEAMTKDLWLRAAVVVMIAIINFFEFGSLTVTIFDIVAFIILFSVPPELFKNEINDEKKNRQKALDVAIEQLHCARDKWQGDANENNFAQKIDELTHKKAEYENLDNEFQENLEKFRLKRLKQEQTKHLKTQLVNIKNLPGLSPIERGLFISAGIKSANNVDRKKFENPRCENIPNEQKEKLYEWRRGILKKYDEENPPKTDLSVKKSFDEAFNLAKYEQQAILLAGPQELRQIMREAHAELFNANQAVAQAKKDFKAFY